MAIHLRKPPNAFRQQFRGLPRSEDRPRHTVGDEHNRVRTLSKVVSIKDLHKVMTSSPHAKRSFENARSQAGAWERDFGATFISVSAPFRSAMYRHSQSQNVETNIGPEASRCDSFWRRCEQRGRALALFGDSNGDTALWTSRLKSWEHLCVLVSCSFRLPEQAEADPWRD